MSRNLVLLKWICRESSDGDDNQYTFPQASTSRPHIMIALSGPENYSCIEKIT